MPDQGTKVALVLAVFMRLVMNAAVCHPPGSRMWKAKDRPPERSLREGAGPKDLHRTTVQLLFCEDVEKAGPAS